jgi:hypothetical protein
VATTGAAILLFSLPLSSHSTPITQLEEKNMVQNDYHIANAIHHDQIEIEFPSSFSFSLTDFISISFPVASLCDQWKGMKTIFT